MIHWEFYKNSEMTDALVSVWQDLCSENAHGNPALDYRMTTLLIKYFGSGQERMGFCMQDGNYVAATVIQPEKFGVWTLFVPGQACLSPFVYKSSLPVKHILASLVRAIPGACWALKLSKVDSALLDIDGIDDELPSDVSRYGKTFAIAVDGDFDAYWKARSKNLRRNIRKALNTIDQNGKSMDFKVFVESENVSECVEVHGFLESSGWKGQAGSAVHIENNQGQFYLDLLRTYADSGNAFMVRLSISGEPAASLLCIKKNEVVVVLKIAYQQEFSDMRPGRLVDYLFLEWCNNRPGDFKLLDMYTNASKDDLSWATDTRVMCNINIYRYRIAKHAIAVYKKIKELLGKK